MGSGGTENVDKDTKINIMFLIAKYMKIFGSSYQDTINMNWFTFNELLATMSAINAEEDLRHLLIADNHLGANSTDKEACMRLYKNLEEKIKIGGFSQSYSKTKIENDLKKLNAMLKGGAV